MTYSYSHNTIMTERHGTQNMRGVCVRAVWEQGLLSIRGTKLWINPRTKTQVIPQSSYQVKLSQCLGERGQAVARITSPLVSAVESSRQNSDSTATKGHAKADHQPSQVLTRKTEVLLDDSRNRSPVGRPTKPRSCRMTRKPRSCRIICKSKSSWMTRKTEVLSNDPQNRGPVE